MIGHNWSDEADGQAPENKSTGGSEIPEGEGRFPWWIWAAFLIWLIYAFLIGPFDLTSPGR